MAFVQAHTCSLCLLSVSQKSCDGVAQCGGSTSEHAERQDKILLGTALAVIQYLVCMEHR